MRYLTQQPLYVTYTPLVIHLPAPSKALSTAASPLAQVPMLCARTIPVYSQCQDHPRTIPIKGGKFPADVLAAYLGQRRNTLRNYYHNFQKSMKTPVRGVTFQAEFDFEGPKAQFHAKYGQKSVAILDQAFTRRTLP